MAKLVLPKSAYKGIPGVKKCKKQTSPEYEELAEKATKRIREKQLQQAKAAKYDRKLLLQIILLAWPKISILH